MAGKQYSLHRTQVFATTSAINPIIYLSNSFRLNKIGFECSILNMCKGAEVFKYDRPSMGPLLLGSHDHNFPKKSFILWAIT